METAPTSERFLPGYLVNPQQHVFCVRCRFQLAGDKKLYNVARLAKLGFKAG